MDNLCHSLAGAAIAQAGFARRVPRATILGIIAANVPDVDAFIYFFGDSASAVAFRRGWTHGLPAIVLWTVGLAAAFGALNRWRPAAVPDPGWRGYAALAGLAVLSHPALDWLNTYGVRFLMPFSGRWYYGDTLFIVDPVLLALFGAGWIVSSRANAAGASWGPRPARAALALALLYIAGMKAMSAATRAEAIRALAPPAADARSLMVVPRPLRWSARDVVVRAGATHDRYESAWNGMRPAIGELRWRDPTGDDPAVVAAVRATSAGERFLRWSRFPYFVPGDGAEAGTVFVGDYRYSAGPVESWAGIRVRVGQGAVGMP